MRKKILLLLCVIPFIPSAQNYQNICSPGTTFFQDSTLHLKAFRRDSVAPQGNGDTIFFSYLAIRDTSDGYNDCKDIANGDILGRKIYKKHDGWIFFFNEYTDSIRINSQADLNETWNFFDLPFIGYIQAKVTSIINDSILGTTDQVKVITFQAKDQGNNNIPHFLNQKTIKLSQHYGFSRMLDVYYVPSGTVFYKLAGKSTPALGVQDFTMKDVYNYDVGDIFHYTGSGSGGGGGGYWKLINKILGKTVYGNMDSATYVVEACKNMFSYPPGIYTNFHDTMNVKYNFIEMDGNPIYSRLPDEFYGSYLFSRTASTKTLTWGVYTYSSWENCYTYPPEGVDETTDSYSPGLGCTYNAFYEMESGNVYQNSQTLVYYKKGNITWGTPVATDCNALVDVKLLADRGKPAIRVVPNPVETKATIIVENYFPGKNLQFDLYNYLGKKILHSLIKSDFFTFSRDGIPSGLYLYTFLNENGVVIGQGKIIMK